ncbi:hypothetical protein Tco_0696714 [Tanacetum coccineum]
MKHFLLKTLGSVALQDKNLCDQSDKTCVSGPEALTSQSLAKRTYWGHYGANYTSRKSLTRGFFWPTSIRMAHDFAPRKIVLWSDKLDDALWCLPPQLNKTPMGATPLKPSVGLNGKALSSNRSESSLNELNELPDQPRKLFDYKETEDFLGQIESVGPDIHHCPKFFLYGTTTKPKVVPDLQCVLCSPWTNKFGGRGQRRDPKQAIRGRGTPMLIVYCRISRIVKTLKYPHEFHILSFSLGIQYPNLID